MKNTKTALLATSHVRQEQRRRLHPSPDTVPRSSCPALHPGRPSPSDAATQPKEIKAVPKIRRQVGCTRVSRQTGRTWLPGERRWRYCWAPWRESAESSYGREVTFKAATKLWHRYLDRTNTSVEPILACFDLCVEPFAGFHEEWFQPPRGGTLVGKSGYLPPIVGRDSQMPRFDKIVSKTKTRKSSNPKKTLLDLSIADPPRDLFLFFYHDFANRGLWLALSVGSKCGARRNGRPISSPCCYLLFLPCM